MVVVTGEILRQLPAGEVVGADDAVHDARLFEHDEVAVHGALGELAATGEDLRDRERAGRGAERVDERFTVGGESLPHTGAVARSPSRGRRPSSRPWAAIVPAATTVALVDPTERFTELLERPESDIALDEACFLIAAHAHPDLDVDERRAQLDALAASLDVSDAGALAHALFDDLGFAGNTIDYADPENSYLDAVLDRRLGIPITLSVLMIEVGRRRGIDVHGVGMPGHFLVGSARVSGTTRFTAVSRSTTTGASRASPSCRTRRRSFPAFLAPVGPVAILDRMLANLQHSLIERAPARAAWPTRLRLRIPGISPAAAAPSSPRCLGSLGQFSEAATELDTLARDLPGSGAEQAAQAAARFRARAN